MYIQRIATKNIPPTKVIEWEKANGCAVQYVHSCFGHAPIRELYGKDHEYILENQRNDA